MSALPEAATSLEELLQLLRETPQGGLSLDAISALRAAIRRLGYDDPHWTDVDEARHILGVTSPMTVPTLAQAGLLRSRLSPEGRLEVGFVDLLHERLVREGLLAIGGDELTPDELQGFGTVQPVSATRGREEHAR
jgi:hypothetical protein